MASKYPAVSVCMATFNGSTYITEQLGSIVPQLLEQDELIVSDDSSNDGTLEIVNRFKFPGLTILPDQKFSNPIFNFENALRHAKNDVLVLADQDDVWLPNKLNLIREKFVARTGSVFAIVLDGCVTDATGNEVHPSLFRRMGSGPGILKNIYDNTFLGCCMALSRPTLELALPFPRRIPMHDMWIGLVASAFGAVEFVPISTIRYRKHGQSLTDFRRAFRPITQIKRRILLSTYLANRVWERRRSAREG